MAESPFFKHFSSLSTTDQRSGDQSGSKSSGRSSSVEWLQTRMARSSFGSVRTFGSRVMTAVQEIRQRPLLGMAVFLGLGGLLLSSYGFWRLQSDAYLVCDPGAVLADVRAANQTASGSDLVPKVQASQEAEAALEKTEAVAETPAADSGAGEESASTGSRQLLIRVDVAGAVKNPGVYELSESSRLGDAIAAAGGLSLEANALEVAQVLNLASKIRDAQKIYVPFAGETLASVLGGGEEYVDTELVTESGNTAGGTDTQESSSAQSNEGSMVSNQDQAKTAGESTAVSTKVSLNTATAEELMALKGIGEVRAGNIIAGRPYTSVDELLTKGVLTVSLFEDLKDEFSL